jgi:N-acetylglucosaminyl-diphospho-decaprenol L-rhamnosyltransferase
MFMHERGSNQAIPMLAHRRADGKSMDVTVTIVNWNRADLLERCLHSVLSSEGPLQIEVIVVDNASTDHAVAMVRERFPSVSLITNSENVGFGRAHNQATAEANGRYILMLNNDAAVFPDTIAALVRFMDNHPRAGICTCAAHSSQQHSRMTGGGVKYFPSIMREALAGLIEFAKPPFGWVDLFFSVKLPNLVIGRCEAFEERQVAWATGALLLVRRAMLDEIGQFDPRFFMFYEETDLCLRAHRSGWSIWQSSDPRYVHENGQSTALRNDRHRIWAASGKAYFRKNQGSWKAVLWCCQYYLIHRFLIGLRSSVGRTLRNRLHIRSAGHLGASVLTDEHQSHLHSVGRRWFQ